MLDRNVKYVKKVLKYLPACTARGRDVWLGGCLIRGVSGPGGPGLGGAWFGGGVWSGGCLPLVQGGIPACNGPDPPVNRMTDRHV